jgi:hypothetical protein
MTSNAAKAAAVRYTFSPSDHADDGCLSIDHAVRIYDALDAIDDTDPKDPEGPYWELMDQHGIQPWERLDHLDVFFLIESMLSLAIDIDHCFAVTGEPQ